MYLPGLYKSYSEKQPLKARILLYLFITLISLAILRTLLPVAIKMGAHYWFDANNIEAEIGEIHISLIDGSFAINNVSGKSATGKNFSLGQFKINWHWKPLFSKQVLIKHIAITSLKADAAFHKDGNMNIAGLIISPGSDKQESPPAVDENPSTPWNATLEAIQLSDIEFCLQQYDEKDSPELDYCARLAHLNWSGNIDYKPSLENKTTLDDKTHGAAPLYVNGSLNLKRFVIQNNLLKLALLDVKAIDIQEINVQTPLNIHVASIGINKLAALQRHTKSGGNDAQLIAFDKLSIQPVSFLALNNLRLGIIQFDGTQSYFRINKKGGTEFANWLPKKEKTKPAAKTKVEPDSNPFHYAFDELTFNTGKHILFIDDSLKEPFSIDIHAIDFKLTKLDSSKPEIPSHASLSLKVNKHGKINVDTDLNPLTKKISLKGDGKISGLDLRIFAPYTKQHVGHYIRSGQLDADLNLGVKNGVIKSNIDLVLHHLALKEISEKEAEELNSEFSFPLNSALSLLRDRDNTIRLTIPVSGDTENPEFDPGDAIITASSGAITSAVIQYYTPFGLLFAAGTLFDLATALNFEPVIFEPNQAILTTSHFEQLDKLATLMTERPGVHLTLCGISSSADQKALFPEVEKTAVDNESEADGDTSPVKPLTKEQLTTLKKIAEARSSNIKDYLIQKKTIKASRLIECAPEFEKDGINGVEISI